MQLRHLPKMPVAGRRSAKLQQIIVVKQNTDLFSAKTLGRQSVHTGLSNPHSTLKPLQDFCIAMNYK